MRLAVGGAATVAASVAVVCAVALSNAAALADTAGRPLAFERVEVPLATSSPTPAASPLVVPTPTPQPPSASESPETVPAPEPLEVAPATPAPRAAEPSAPAPESAVTPDQSGRQAAASAAAWERLLRWAHSKGWSDADVAEWIADNKDRLSDWKALWQATQTPAGHAGSPSVADRWSRDGSKKDQSPSSPNGRD